MLLLLVVLLQKRPGRRILVTLRRSDRSARALVSHAGNGAARSAAEASPRRADAAAMRAHAVACLLVMSAAAINKPRASKALTPREFEK